MSSLCDPQKDLRLTNKQKEQAMDRPLREDKVQRSQVVFFSNLPREDEKKKELLTVAGRFGIVEKHLFLSDQVGSSATPHNVKLISHHSVLEFQISNCMFHNQMLSPCRK